MNNKSFLSATIIVLGTITSVGAYAISSSETHAGDYTITTEEMRNQAEDMNSSSQVQFDAIDADSNGTITEEELSSLYSGKKFTEIDADKDGKVTREEMDNAVSMTN
jgi:Ca2+-binding EF-hand superfamily protein